MKSALHEQLARRWGAPSQHFCCVCTTPVGGESKCDPGCGVLVCSTHCYKLHRARRCPRIFIAGFSVGDASIGPDLGWRWALPNSQVEVIIAAIETRSLSIPSVVVVSFLEAALLRTRTFKGNMEAVLRVMRQRVRSLRKWSTFLVTSERRFLFVHPHVSLIWETQDWKDLSETKGILCVSSRVLRAKFGLCITLGSVWKFLV